MVLIITLLLLIGQVVATRLTCKEHTICICSADLDDRLELNCNVEDNQVAVKIHDDVHFSMECDSSALDYNELSNITYGGFETVTLSGCPLPSTSLGDILSTIGILKASKLHFVNVNISNQLQRHHLKGINVSQLRLSNDGIVEFSNDLFADIQNLTKLTLRGNHISLKEDLFASAPGLNSLELTLNNIPELSVCSFRGLTSLRKLYLWRNSIQNISKGSFEGLDMLEELDLSSNEIKYLPEDTFHWTPKLTNLSLFSNRLTELPSGLFRNKSHLSLVQLFDNRAELLRLPSGLLSELPELRILKLQRCGIRELPNDLFLGSHAIQHISLSGNHIESLPEDIFRDQTELRELHLNENKIRVLKPSIFSSLIRLKELRLERNMIEELPSGIFSTLMEVKSINLEWNKIRYIGSAAFSSNLQLKLENIQLAHNQIQTLDSFNLTDMDSEYPHLVTLSPFSGLLHLRSLNLSFNQLGYIYSDWRTALLQLEYLDLSYNNFKWLAYTDISFVNDKVVVDLKHNNITGVDFSMAESEARDESHTGSNHESSTTRVLLDDNPFSCDCLMYWFVRYLQGDMTHVHGVVNAVVSSSCETPSELRGQLLRSLDANTLLCPLETACDLSGCDCSVRASDRALVAWCSNGSPQLLPDLAPLRLNQTELHMHYSGLNETDAAFLAAQEHVTALYLAGNKLRLLRSDLIPERLQVLDVRNNSIEIVNETIAQKLLNSSSIKYVWVSGNPFVCSCDNLAFFSLLQGKRTMVKDFERVKCYKTDTGKWRYVSNLAVGALCGNATNLAIPGALLALFALAAAAGVTAALYYKYDERVKLFLLARGLCPKLRGITEEELDANKRYDAFLSFCHKDEEFVINELVAGLESGSNPYKLCIHYRDWTVGEWIPAQIARSVEDSRRTIVVLSPNFLKSVWGHMEFRAAHGKALSEGRARVIVVLYGDIGSEEKLSPELKAYLSTNTYVKWGDPWFWDKLRQALPRHNLVNTKNGLTKVMKMTPETAPPA